MTIQSVAMQQALEQLRAMREAVKPVGAGAEMPRGIVATTTPPATGAGSFMDTMRSAVDSENDQQRLSRQLQTSYVRGEDVSLTDVAIAMQRSSVAFEATVQVRNKILESYKEIMNITV
jgi:flagellar hook-basal body complex protein FliE